MRLGTVVARGAICLASIALACSDDDDGGDPTCASGYVLKGGICVKPSDGTGGSGTTAGTTSTAGKDEGGAGNASTGGAAGAAAGGDAALAGMGGATDAGGADAGGAGAGGVADDGPVAPEVLATRWLVFSHEKGVFAYDTSKFPVEAGLVALSEKAQIPASQGLVWSPSGRTLLYQDVGDVYAVDLSGDTPSGARLLLSTPAAPSVQLKLVQPWSWSADSSSVALVSGTTLSVLDPSQAAPTLHPLTTKLKSFSWAPYGGRLLYTDDTGSYVVQVTQGAPGTAVAVDSGASVWSPNGAQLAGVKDGDLALTTLSGAEASLELLTTAQASNDPPEALDPAYIRFNKTGSKLAFAGQLDVDANFSGYTLALKPRGAPVVVPSDAPAGAETSCHSWSPDGKLLLCAYDTVAGSQWFVVDVAARSSTKILDVGSYGDWTWSPDPARHQLFTSAIGGNQQLAMVDLAKADTAVPIYAGSTTFSASPVGSLLTYLSKPSIQLVNLDAAVLTPVGVYTAPSADDVPAWGWAPNGRFIAVADGSHQQRLMRIDGAGASTPVALQGISASTIYFAWQP